MTAYGVPDVRNNGQRDLHSSNKIKGRSVDSIVILFKHVYATQHERHKRIYQQQNCYD